MPRVKQFNEEEVLNKAMELFWKKGFHATSMQDLIDALGINRASLYDTFGGKQQLFDQAFARYKSINRKRLLDILDSGNTFKDGFKNLFKTAINEAITDPNRKGCFVVNTATAISGENDTQLPIIQENKNFIETTFYELLKKAEKKGDLKKGKDLRGLAQVIFTFYNGFQVTAKIDPNKEKLQNSVDQLLRLLD